MKNETSSIADLAIETLSEMVVDLVTQLEAIKAVIAERLEHDKEHFKFYCPVCDDRDTAFLNILGDK